MQRRIRIIKHEGVPGGGSLRSASQTAGRPSILLDDLPGRAAAAAVGDADARGGAGAGPGTRAGGAVHSWIASFNPRPFHRVRSDGLHAR
jgi:hypothetical protein